MSGCPEHIKKPAGIIFLPVLRFLGCGLAHQNSSPAGSAKKARPSAGRKTRNMGGSLVCGNFERRPLHGKHLRAQGGGLLQIVRDEQHQPRPVRGNEGGG